MSIELTAAKPKYSHYPPVIKRNARRMFINGEALLPVISSELNVPLTTLKQWAAKGAWYMTRKHRLDLLESQTTPPPELTDSQFQAKIMTDAREQIISKMIMLRDETDPQRIDRLSNAIARLAELERQLAGRPLPGSLKPVQPRPGRSRAYPAPVPVASEPVPQPPAPTVQVSSNETPEVSNTELPS